jgi:hypothetical protein
MWVSIINQRSRTHKYFHILSANVLGIQHTKINLD